MAVLRVIDPGMFTTVQDLGRPSHCAIGVPPSGAADTTALIAGNRLLGNADDTAALECTLTGPSVGFDRDAWVCLTGATCPQARIVRDNRERPLPWCEPVRVARNETVQIGAMSDGARAYLSNSGGLAVPRVLGSRSTCASAHLGGHEGRALRRGDEISLGEPAGEPRMVPDGLHAWLRAQVERSSIRVVPSLDAGRFPLAATGQFAAASFTVREQSSRIGLRLSGPVIALPEDATLSESEPTVTGGIQIAGDGLPIILGSDRPATGGYPMMACVIGADLGVVAMLRPRDNVRFEWVTIHNARRLTSEQRQRLDSLLPVSRNSAGQ